MGVLNSKVNQVVARVEALEAQLLAGSGAGGGRASRSGGAATNSALNPLFSDSDGSPGKVGGAEAPGGTACEGMWHLGAQRFEAWRHLGGTAFEGVW